MKLYLKNRSARRRIFRRPGGFTLVEMMFYVLLSSVILAAIIATLLTALRIYYTENDYLSIGGQSRQLIDDLVETGTFADDMVIFRDISDHTLVAQSDRGDCLMFFNRDNSGAGNISSFVCYYLAEGTGGVTLWRFNGTPGPVTPDAGAALTDYTRTRLKQVSSIIGVGILPRAAVPATTPLTPRAGVFTNDGARRAQNGPTVLINLPAKLLARVGTPATTSDITVAITPRH